MNKILNIIDSKIMWGPVMIVFLLGSHIYLTYKTGFVQKHLGKGIKLSLTKENSDKGDLSVFGSLMTALSSTIGTGNIVGVGTAIVMGGPGAVFWTWIGGIFGIATKYAESYIAVKHRVKHSNGQYSGGAMTAFEKMNKPFMAKLFAVLCALCAFGIGCATQAASIVDIVTGTFEINRYVIAISLVILVGLVIFGGLTAISKVCERLVPVMSIVYIVGCFYILVMNGKYLPETISLILSSAFTVKSAAGGFVGSTIIIAARYGIDRGLFSNEAGMGSAPQATASSVAKNAVKPALVGSTGVFWDTVVVCLMTGLVLVSSVIANNDISSIGISGANLCSACFGQIPFGSQILVFGILTFAYSTILGWNSYGINCCRYLFGHKSIPIYNLLWLAVVFVGSIIPESSAWTIASILNACMVIPNMIAVLMEKDKIAKDTKYYLDENHLDEIDKELA